jgi:hypothetical protein
MVRVNEVCSFCPFGTIYNSSEQVCQNICNLTTSFYQNGVCQCLKTSGYFLINNTCQQCPSNSIFNETSSMCVNNQSCSVN